MVITKREDQNVKRLVEGQGLRKSGAIMGLDVHKDLIQYCIATETKILDEIQLENRKSGLKKLMEVIQKRKVRSVAMESTSQYHIKIVYYLLDKNIPILVANPQQTKQSQGKKTDKLDARRIAIAHRDGRLKPSVLPHYDYWMLRKAMRTLISLKHDATKHKQRISQVFHQKDFTNKKLLTSNMGLDILSLISNGTITEQNIIKLLNSSKSKKKTKLSKEEILELTQFQASLKPMERTTFGSEIIQLKVNKLLQEQQQLIYVEFAKNDESFRTCMEWLLSIPGVGPDTAAMILAEIADISYFETSASLVKWAGLAPRVYQSGHKKNITGKIHKGGNKFLRRAVVLAAKNIYDKAKSNPLHQLMREKKELKESKTNKKAYWYVLCIGARKLLVHIHYMLKHQCTWKLMSVPKEAVENVKNYIAKKIRLFLRKIAQYEQAKERIPKAIDLIISGMSVPEISPKYLLRQLFTQSPKYCYT